MEKKMERETGASLTVWGVLVCIGVMLGIIWG